MSKYINITDQYECVIFDSFESPKKKQEKYGTFVFNSKNAKPEKSGVMGNITDFG